VIFQGGAVVTNLIQLENSNVTPVVGNIYTIAGNGTAGYSGDGGLAISAELNHPFGVAVDNAGNIYIADASNSVIREVTASTGDISTVAGLGTAGYSGDGGPAISAELNNPYGVALDSGGNIYITGGDSRVRVIYMGGAVAAVLIQFENSNATPVVGNIYTVAGNGTAGYSGDGGQATSAELVLPIGVAVDSTGNIYISEFLSDRIREVNASTGNISTVAGNGVYGYSGDGGPAVLAELAIPFGIAIDAGENIYFADFGNSRIRVVGSGLTAASVSISCSPGTIVYGSSTTCTATVSGSSPTGTVTFTYNNNSWTSCTLSSGSCSVSGLDSIAAGTYTIAGNYSGDGSNAPANGSTSVTISIASGGTPQTITFTAPSSPVTYGVSPIALSASASSGLAVTFSVVSGPGSLSGSTLTITGAGTVVVAANQAGDNNYAAAPQVTQSVVVDQATPVIIWPVPTPIAYGTTLGATQLNAAASVAGTSVAGKYIPVVGTFSYSPASGTVLTAGNQVLNVTFTPTNITDFSPANGAIALTVEKVAPIITWPTPANVIPGTALSSVQLNAAASVPGTFVYSPANGTVMAAGSQTLSLTFTPTDTTNYNVVTASVTLTAGFTPGPGIITTVAGNGTEGFSGDGGLATDAELDRASRVGVDGAANLYIADEYNQRIRRVDATTGAITTVAGNGTAGNAGDGGLATSAELYYPSNIAVDATGNIYVVDYLHARIREVAASTGIISTVAGNGTSGYTGDGGIATSAEISPGGIWIDGADNIYFINPVYSNGPNTWSYYLRKVMASTGVITTIATVGIGSAEDPVDVAGNIYFVSNNNINKLTASTGNISLVAGNGTSGYTGDGGQATSAEIQTDNGFDVDNAGNIYILSYEGTVPTVRKVSALTGTIDTVVGGISGCSQQSNNVGDGCPAVDGILNTPEGIAADANGNIYIADYWGQRIRAVGALIPPNVSVSCSPNPIIFGRSNSQCAVSVDNEATGTVTLRYNGTTWTTLTLAAGTASAIWPSTTGGGMFSIAATYNGDASHSAAIGSTTLNVTQLTPTIVWPSPAPILYGTQLSATQLDASADVPGSFAYSPATGTTLPIGINTLTATFSPQSSGYSSVTATTSLIVNSVETTLPTITGIIPNPAAVGSTVTISGDLFGAAQGSSAVTFNGVLATAASWTNDAIVVNVPVGATTGPVLVNVNGTLSNSFLLMVPVSCGP
jgi:sugar lactone lactonase YvrE